MKMVFEEVVSEIQITDRKMKIKRIDFFLIAVFSVCVLSITGCRKKLSDNQILEVKLSEKY